MLFCMNSLPFRNAALSVDSRVSDLLGRLTPEEKLAQLSGLWRDHGRLQDEAGRFSPTAATRLMPHGIGSVSRQRESLSPRASAHHANEIQRWLREHTRLGIPAMFHAEGLHGDMEQGGTHFPQPLGLASCWDASFVEQIFTVVAREVRARGAHHVLGPNLDLGLEPRWGRTEETYGEDPWLVAELGTAAVRGLQGRRPGMIPGDRVLATGKHFVGHGQPEAGTNGAPVHVTPRQLRDTHLVPFGKAVREAGLASIMPAYHEIDGIPCHANAWLLRTLLRDTWGFQGLVVSDYYAIEQLRSRHSVVADKTAAALLAFDAGVDVELPDVDCFRALGDAAAAGRLDDAVRRVLAWKFRLGLFENPWVDVESVSLVNAPNHRALAREAAVRACVLLKNQDALLPMDPARLNRVAVIGPNADRVHLGGYSDNPGTGTSVLDGLRSRLGEERIAFAPGCRITREGGDWWADTATLPDPAENARLIREAAETARAADVVVLVIGGNEDTNKEGWHETHLGDRDTIELPEPQTALFEAVHATGKPVVVVLIHSGPLAIPVVAEKAPAILDAFYPGQEGGDAIAAVLLGDEIPTGKLAITYPRSTGQIPAAYNHKPTSRRGYLFTSTAPLFPFGHGVSYTTYAYSAPRLASATIRVGESTQVEVTVTNTGSRAGEEIVQLYLRDEVSSVTRPVRELRGFARVKLVPGESKTIQLPIGPEHLRFTNAEMQSVVEPGFFTVYVGPDSQTQNSVRLEVVS